MCGIGAPAEKHGGLAAGRCISLLPGARTTVAGAAVLGLAGSPERGVLDEQGGEADGVSVPVPPRKILADRVQRRPRREQKKAGRDVAGVKWSWSQVYEAFADPVVYSCMLDAFQSCVLKWVDLSHAIPQTPPY